MALKLVLILLVIFLGLIVVLPFVLSIIGGGTLQLGTPVGGTVTREDAVLLRTPNEGESWENSSVSENKKNEFPEQIFTFTYHPTNPDIMFLGTKSSALWKTTNGGAFWAKVADQARVLDPRADVYRILIASTDHNIMYTAVFQNRRGRVLKSEDAGESFHEVYFTPADNYIVSDIHVNPRDQNHVIIATGQGGVLESRNGGKTWRVVKWFTAAISKLLVNPLNANEMILLLANGVLFKSVDGGANWADITKGIEDTEVFTPGLTAPSFNPFKGLTLSREGSIQALVADPNNFSTLYIGSADGLLRSTDGGFTWKRVDVLIPPDAFPITTVAIHPRFPNTLFVGASTQIHRTDDGGTNWSVKTLPTPTRVKNLLIHPLRPEMMFAILGR